MNVKITQPSIDWFFEPCWDETYQTWISFVLSGSRKPLYGTVKTEQLEPADITDQIFIGAFLDI